MICEICGKRTAQTIKKIEGAEIQVCNICAGEIKEDKKDLKDKKIYIYEIDKDGLAEALKSYRGEKSYKELALELKISEHDLKRIEQKKVVDIQIIKRLENLFKRKFILKEFIDTESSKESDNKVSLQDILKWE
jgi:ribosome-binding protein aMBF1 (putative translation factor)